MPTPSNPAPLATTAATRKMPRLRRAGNTIKILASIFVFAFLCAYAHTWLRYGNVAPRPQTTASVTRSTPQSFFTPTHPRPSHRRQSILRPVHQAKRHPRRSNPYYLASMRRLRRLFSQLLVVRS